MGIVGGEGEAGETYTTNAKLEEDAGSKKIKKIKGGSGRKVLQSYTAKTKYGGRC